MRSRLYLNLGLVYENQADLSSARKFMEKALNIVKQVPSTNKLTSRLDGSQSHVISGTKCRRIWETRLPQDCTAAPFSTADFKYPSMAMTNVLCGPGFLLVLLFCTPPPPPPPPPPP